ncbi:WXG100 family type VII secretion target [Streptomyces sp. NPDC006197]|uniref:WXG100 family type VII secretion target n=1 Tax=Streptomyces sp. NPDC006197 TaxID=3156685 RepID=UPI0033A5E149
MNAAPHTASSAGIAGTPGAAADLAVDGSELKTLAGDLDTMQEVLGKQLLRMDEIVDRIESRWRGPASEAYRVRHRAAAEDAVRIRETMKILAEAIRLSKDGFSAQELENLRQFRRARSHTDIQAEADALSTPNTEPAPPSAPRSRIADL